MNPETKLDPSSIQALHDKYMFPCVSNYYEDPLPLAHGKGMYLTDLDGTDYLDFFGGILTVSVGHCNEHVNASLHRQIDTLQHTSTLYPTAPMVNLAKKLADITPGDLEKCFFACSGSEADETAVHLARIATERDEIIALRHGYSGRTELTMNLTAHAPWRRAGSSIGYIKHAHNAYCYRCPFGLSYPNCDLQCAQDIEELIQTTTSGEPAAFLAEPIQGVGGFITPPKEYFEIAVGIVRKYGGLFISDEVQTGFGRTGDKWCGIEHWNVEPDIITFAKGIANGLPLSAVIAKPEIADHFGGLSISTFGGNPVTASAALATLEYMEEKDLPSNAKIQGDRLRSGLEVLQEKHQSIGDVRGMGLMQALEIVDPNSSDGKAPDAEKMSLLLDKTKDLGLLVGKGGLYANVIRISPPMIADASDVDRALDILDQAFAAVG